MPIIYPNSANQTVSPLFSGTVGDLNIAVPLAQLEITPRIPAVAGGGSVAVPAKALTITVNVPVVDTQIYVNVPAKAITITLRTPSVTVYDFFREVAGGAFWSVPIPDNSTYLPITFTPTGDPAGTGIRYNEVHYSDLNYRVIATNSDPSVNHYVPGAWDDRDSGTTLIGTIRMPFSFTLADASPGNTPNNPMIHWNQTTDTFTKINAACRPTAGGNFWGYNVQSHGGSQLTGGEITLVELNSGVIGHALAININGTWLDRIGGVGYLPPATAEDSNASTAYTGSMPELRMGTRLAINPSETPVSLGLSTTYGATLLEALQTYGAFIVDTTGWSAVSLNVLNDVGSLFEEPSNEADDIRILFGAMQVCLTRVAVPLAQLEITPRIPAVAGGGSVAVPAKALTITVNVPVVEMGYDPTDFMTVLSWHKPNGSLGSQAGTNFDVSGGEITKWWDSSGNGHHATQPSGSGNQPIYTAAAFNGYPAAEIGNISGNKKSLDMANPNIANNRSGLTIYIVSRNESTNKYVPLFYASLNSNSGEDRVGIFYGDGTNRMLTEQRRLDADSKDSNFSASGVYDPTYASVNFDIHIIKIDFTNGLLNQWINGTQIFTNETINGGGNSQASDSARVSLGNDLSWQTITDDIFLMEVLVADGLEDSTSDTAFTGYASAKYNQ